MITVIVPIHNTKKYIDKCLNSIKRQTYKNIEVLCIDSSDDETTKIVEEYTKNDKRFRLIYDKNNSYGYKVNLGITKSKGQYIAIVDSDDYIDINMYENAYEAIRKYKSDFVKYDYESFFDDSNKKKSYTYCSRDKELYNDTFNSKQKPNVFYDSNVAIWSGLYRKKFIIDNGIKLNEAPGASFQDTSFYILTLLYAKRIRFIEESYYKYRRNNVDCSSSSRKNVYSVIGEFDYILEQVNKNNNVSLEQYRAILCRRIFVYSWNYLRLTDDLAARFKRKIAKELKEFKKTEAYNGYPEYIRNYIFDSGLLDDK